MLDKYLLRAFYVLEPRGYKDKKDMVPTLIMLMLLITSNISVTLLFAVL